MKPSINISYYDLRNAQPLYFMEWIVPYSSSWSKCTFLGHFSTSCCATIGISFKYLEYCFFPKNVLNRINSWVETFYFFKFSTKHWKFIKNKIIEKNATWYPLLRENTRFFLFFTIFWCFFNVFLPWK